MTGRGPALPLRLLELQVGWIYLMTGLEKMAGTLWKNGTATFYALQLEHTFGRSWAYPLATNMIVVNLMSWGTLAVELLFLPLSMIPWRVTRLLAVAAAAMLHGGILTMMNVGNFPVIMLSTLIIFLPADWVRTFVEDIESRVSPRLSPRLAAAAAGATRELRQVPALPLRTVGVTSLPGVRAGGALLLLAVTAVAFASALPSWAAAYRPQGELARILVFSSLDQRWDMFSPDPAQADGWMLAPAGEHGAALVRSSLHAVGQGIRADRKRRLRRLPARVWSLLLPPPQLPSTTRTESAGFVRARLHRADDPPAGRGADASRVPDLVAPVLTGA
ncbi:MAG: hypothetical protein E6J13_11275 [Chloroflexi bacterium]|nr:MAG: hypothetical protein E6J13_11275 [Chloroflexota bacterium]